MEPAQVSPEVAKVLVDNHRAFLAFLERRVGSKEVAEDILQEAFTRGIDRAGTIRDNESVLAWFYRALRNAVVDHYRRNDVKRRSLEGFAQELESTTVPKETVEAVCKCVLSLADTLKPEYADAIRRIDVEGMAVKDFAAETGLTANNAGVRVFRARDALRKQVARSCGTCAEHGCLDCTCGAAASSHDHAHDHGDHGCDEH
jgi:RNA polymerase sigma-70 factor (ECF subfamily)